MTKFLFIALVAALAWMRPSVAHADVVTAMEMLPGCKLDVRAGEHQQPPPQEDMENISQAGTCMGMADMALLATNCAPPDVPVGEVVRIFIKFADDHPEFLHLQASSVMITAVAHAYGCTIKMVDGKPVLHPARR